MRTPQDRSPCPALAQEPGHSSWLCLLGEISCILHGAGPRRGQRAVPRCWRAWFLFAALYFGEGERRLGPVERMEICK